MYISCQHNIKPGIYGLYKLWMKYNMIPVNVYFKTYDEKILLSEQSVEIAMLVANTLYKLNLLCTPTGKAVK